MELERMLRQYEPLRGVEVAHESEFRAAIAPQEVVVRGIVHINGEPTAYEAGVNLDQFVDRRDVERLVRGLFESFERAEKGVVRQ
jgi:hypothetical protein